MSAMRRAVCAQAIKLETIGRGGLFAEFLFAGCDKSLDAIIDARAVDLLVLAVLQKRLPLRFCNCENAGPCALAGNMSCLGIPVDPQRTVAIHVFALGARRQLRLMDWTSFSVAAIEG
jgi:hypothetical protein